MDSNGALSQGTEKFLCSSRSRQQRKRKRCQSSLSSCELPWNPLDTIRTFLPPPNKIFTLVEFLQHYAPFLVVNNKTNNNNVTSMCIEEEIMFRIVISPLDCMRPAAASSPQLTSPECRQSVPSIVDDVVWTLVQRRDHWKRLGKDGRNVLADGFSSPSFDDQVQDRSMGSQTMRTGVFQWGSNDNVTYCKTSRVFQRLHTYAGDEVLRMILLYTRLFLPMENDFDNPRGNYIQICGPPLNVTAMPRQLQHNLIPWGGDHKSNITSDGVPHNRKKTKKRRPKNNRHVAKSARDSKNLTLQANSTLSRHTLFYSDSFFPKVGFHQNHPIHDSTMTPPKLLCIILGISAKKGSLQKNKRWRRVCNFGVDICREMLAKMKTFDYHRTLQKYCPLPDCIPRKDFGENRADDSLLPVLVQAFSPSDQLVSFLTSMLRNVVPMHFWGSQHNLDCVIGTVKTFVNLRRKERLANKRLMYGIRITDMKWLQGEKRKGFKLSRTDHEVATTLALKCLRWVFRSLVIPLLRSSFYVTETECFARKVVYYRKPVWSLFRALSMQKLLKRQFRELKEKDVLRRLKAQTMGFSHLRLVPKATGVRPIAHLSRAQKVTIPQRSKVGTGSSQEEQFLESTGLSKTATASTNSVLKHVFEVLTYECGRRDHLFGSGLQGLTDFYPRYKNYISTLRQQQAGEESSLDLIFASVDIEKCYDNIHQEYMCDLSKRQLLQNDYIIQKCNIFYGNRVTGGLERLSKKTIGPPESHDLFHLGKNGMFDHSSNAIFDSRKCQIVRRSKLLGLLEEHLQNNLVLTTGRFGQRYFLQTSGISQGSILSMLLCNLYYGEMEKLLLQHEKSQMQPFRSNCLDAPEQKKFLARLVDDFLCVSTDKPAVCDFLQRMHRGREDLGVQINSEKTLVSEPTILQTTMNNKYKIENVRTSPARDPFDKTFFPWCGMLFDTKTGEVLMDYERFQEGKLRNSLTVDGNGQEGWKLATRMKSFVRPRCLPILFDSKLNRRDTIVTNFYQMMLFAAAKTAEQLRGIDGLAVNTPNVSFLLQNIESLARYSGRQIRCNLRKQSPETDTLPLNAKTLSWLSWHAFAAVFTRLLDFPVLGESISAELQSRKYSSPNQLVPIVMKALHQFQLEKIIQLH